MMISSAALLLLLTFVSTIQGQGADKRYSAAASFLPGMDLEKRYSAAASFLPDLEKRYSAAASFLPGMDLDKRYSAAASFLPDLEKRYSAAAAFLPDMEYKRAGGEKRPFHYSAVPDFGKRGRSAFLSALETQLGNVQRPRFFKKSQLNREEQHRNVRKA